jgi:hypothetical protein
MLVEQFQPPQLRCTHGELCLQRLEFDRLVMCQSGQDAPTFLIKFVLVSMRILAHALSGVPGSGQLAPGGD